MKISAPGLAHPDSPRYPESFRSHVILPRMLDKGRRATIAGANGEFYDVPVDQHIINFLETALLPRLNEGCHSERSRGTPSWFLS